MRNEQNKIDREHNEKDLNLFEFQKKIFDEKLFDIFIKEAKSVFGGKNEEETNYKKICFDQKIGTYSTDGLNGSFDYKDRNKLIDAINDHKKDDLKKLKSEFYDLSSNSRIVIILESPHKDEFNENEINGFEIGMPCRGKTGDNLNMYLENMLKFIFLYVELGDDCKKNLSKFLSKKDIYGLICNLWMSDYGIKGKKTDNNQSNTFNSEYDIIVMNSIQYQCSLGRKIDHKKDELCKSLMNKAEFRDNFKVRLKEYNPNLIMNLCTKRIRGTIRELVKDTYKRVDNDMVSNDKEIIYVEGNHPCRWNSNPLYLHMNELTRLIK